jgi:hypothetical protein
MTSLTPTPSYEKKNQGNERSSFTESRSCPNARRSDSLMYAELGKSSSYDAGRDLVDGIYHLLDPANRSRGLPHGEGMGGVYHLLKGSQPPSMQRLCMYDTLTSRHCESDVVTPTSMKDRPLPMVDNDSCVVGHVYHTIDKTVSADAPKFRYCAELFDFTWFHQRITREEANKLLEHREEGTFLVREKDVNFTYALSVSRPNGNVEHNLICRAWRTDGHAGRHFILNNTRLHHCCTVSDVVRYLQRQHGCPSDLPYLSVPLPCCMPNRHSDAQASDYSIPIGPRCVLNKI